MMRLAAIMLLVISTGGCGTVNDTCAAKTTPNRRPR